MRILLASAYNFPGGITRWTEHILNYSTSDDSVQIDLLKGPTPLFKSFNNKNVLRRIIQGIYYYLGYIINEQKELKHQQYDVLHICTSAQYALIKDYLMIVIARHYHVKTIVHFRFGRIPELLKSNNWESWLLRKVARKADFLIPIDRMSYESLLVNGFTNVENVPNPISPEVLSIIESSAIIKENRYVLFVGQCYKAKGIFELIDACKTIDDIKVRFIGSISEETKKEMKKRIPENSKMEIIGEMPYNDVIKEMLKCNVFVLPTYTEGFPNVILESMACGCPIVTTNVGAIPEMLDIENGNNYGICVKPQEIEELNKAIRKMLDDREFALRCGENAQKRVNELYSMPAVWGQLKHIWKNI